MNVTPHRYLLFIYQVPSQPSAARVSIWRELKRIGALYLQQSVCIVPQQEHLLLTLQKVAHRVKELRGNSHLLPLSDLPAEEEAKIIDGFIAQSNLQYDEIIENCDVNFAKEIEFERFRNNFTYAEVEEIRQELDKMHRWFQRVVERDWFGAARQEETRKSIERCEILLEAFEEQVFLKQEGGEAFEDGQEGKPHIHPRRLERHHPPEDVL